MNQEERLQCWLDSWGPQARCLHKWEKVWVTVGTDMPFVYQTHKDGEYHCTKCGKEECRAEH